MGIERWNGSAFKTGGHFERWDAASQTFKSGGWLERWDAASQTFKRIGGGGDPEPAGFPVFRSARSVSGTGGTPTDATAALPDGWQPGDFCLGIFGVNATAGTLTAPADWTPLPTGPSLPNILPSSSWWVGYRILQSGDAAPVYRNSTANLKYTVALTCWSNAQLAAAVHAAETVNRTDHPAPNVTATANNLVIRLLLEKSSTNTTWSTPAGTTRRMAAFGSGGGAMSSVILEASQATAGEAGALTVDSGVATANAAMASVALAGVV